MAGFETPKKTIELGKALIAELTTEPRSTQLSRWVAHYLAEQMTELKQAKGKKRAKAQDRCFGAILQLWRQRDSVPSGLHPFDGFKPVLRALETISPDCRNGYYIRNFDEKRATDNKSAEVVKMAKFIVCADRAARILIEAALETAVEQAKTPRTKVYLKSVQAKSKGGDVVCVTRLMARRQYLDALDPASELAETKRLWEKRLEQLTNFISTATAIQKEFEGRLRRISKAQGDSLAGRLTPSRRTNFRRK